MAQDDFIPRPNVIRFEQKLKAATDRARAQGPEGFARGRTSVAGRSAKTENLRALEERQRGNLRRLKSMG